MESIPESNARRTPAANILTTNSTIVLQAVVDANLKYVTVDVGAYGKHSDIF
jgi:hypothetical protein